MISISASLMCCNPLILGEEIYQLQEAGCDGFHIDIMDGNFVQNFAMSIRDLRFIRKASYLPIDVHLMIRDPSRYIASLAATGIDRIFIHPETCDDCAAVLQQVRQFGIKAGIVLSPYVKFDILTNQVLSLIDTVLVMAVSPGFAGQSFIPETVGRVSMLSRILDNRQIYIEVDGAVSTRTIPILHDEGARKFVAGTSGLFKENISYYQAIKDLKNSIASQNVG
ncbi:MAG: ribulose-phosphate 3-epimerase [Parachlamydiales bacterium]|nr:ribulose-phosphate 3-epimerase [Parachlamydiales bacterium]